MKVQVKNLKPNPFRNMDKYPINRDKIEELKNSIEETEFWGNIVARPKDGKYQLAYGHHRYTTLKELGKTEIDIIVKDLDNSTMLKMMVNDNMDAYNTLPVITLENIRATRDFLNIEIARCQNWEEAKSVAIICRLFQDEPNPKASFAQVKKQGVGHQTIKKYLGKGWEKKRWMIQEALSECTHIGTDLINSCFEVQIGNTLPV